MSDSSSDRWSQEAIEERYAGYAAAYGVTSPRSLTAFEPEKEGSHWVYTVMNRVIEGIEARDPACRELGVEFIEDTGSSASLPFVTVLRSNTARALRRSELTTEQKARLKARIVGMLADGDVPREFQQYAKLLNAIGISRPELTAIEASLKRENEFVLRYYNYLLSGARK